MRRLSAFTLAAAIVATAGCDGTRKTDYSKLDLLEVTGKVTLDGEPKAGLEVVFEAQDKTFSVGKTREDGRYRLSFNSDKFGCKPGPKVVKINWSSGGERNDREMETDAPKGPPIQDRFHRKSELTAVVEPGKTVFDFEVKSK